MFVSVSRGGRWAARRSRGHIIVRACRSNAAPSMASASTTANSTARSTASSGAVNGTDRIVRQRGASHAALISGANASAGSGPEIRNRFPNDLAVQRLPALLRPRDERLVRRRLGRADLDVVAHDADSREVACRERRHRPRPETRRPPLRAAFRRARGVGFEPTTLRLTAECSAVELPPNRVPVVLPATVIRQRAGPGFRPRPSRGSSRTVARTSAPPSVVVPAIA